MAAQQLHASFLNSFFPGVFPNTWQLPDLLSSAPILKWLLLLLHTHTLLHFPLRGRGGWLWDFQFCSLPCHFAQECPRQFYFQFSNSIFGTLRKKTTVTRTSPAPPSSFPHVLHLQVREVFWMLLRSSSSVAVFVYRGRRWQSFTPSSWLLLLQGFHPRCPAHWGFEQAHSQVAWYDWC